MGIFILPAVFIGRWSGISDFRTVFIKAVIFLEVMNWYDGIAVCVVFNVTVALLWLLVPNAFSKMLPPEIRKAAPKREKKEVVILASVLYPLYILIFVYMAVSARQAGVDGFRKGRIL